MILFALGWRELECCGRISRNAVEHFLTVVFAMAGLKRLKKIACRSILWRRDVCNLDSGERLRHCYLSQPRHHGVLDSFSQNPATQQHVMDSQHVFGCLIRQQPGLSVVSEAVAYEDRQSPSPTPAEHHTHF